MRSSDSVIRLDVKSSNAATGIACQLIRLPVRQQLTGRKTHVSTQTDHVDRTVAGDAFPDFVHHPLNLILHDPPHFFRRSVIAFERLAQSQ